MASGGVSLLQMSDRGLLSAVAIAESDFCDDASRSARLR